MTESTETELDLHLRTAGSQIRTPGPGPGPLTAQRMDSEGAVDWTERDTLLAE